MWVRSIYRIGLAVYFFNLLNPVPYPQDKYLLLLIKIDDTYFPSLGTDDTFFCLREGEREWR